MATNDITGDDIRSKANSDKFREGWDAIFNKKDKDAVEDEEEDDGLL